MKNVKRMFATILSLAMLVSLVACGGGEKPAASAPAASKPAASAGTKAPAMESYQWILPLSVDEDSIPFATADKFAELLAEKSGGAIQLDIYPNGQMGGDPEIVESVQSGAYTFFCNMPSSSSAVVPEGAIFDLHGCFSTIEQARSAVDSEEFDALIGAAYEKYNFHILGYSDLGFRMLTSSRQVNNLADMGGLKVRVMENPHQVAFWNGVGASATPMAWGETYLGLQQHTVDGCEQPYDFIVSAKLYEVQDYVYKTNHLFQYCILAMNNDQYQALPDDVKAIVDEASAEACQYGRDLIDSRMVERAKFLEDNGIVIAEAPADVMEKIGQVAEDYADEIISYCGEDIYNAYVAAAK